jgi:hypothetical protein
MRFDSAIAAFKSAQARGLTHGLSERQETIIGPYRYLRTLKDGAEIRCNIDRTQPRF